MKAGPGSGTERSWPALLLHKSLCTVECKETSPWRWTVFFAWFSYVSDPTFNLTYLRPRRRVPFCKRRRPREGLRWIGTMVRAPSLDWWSGADRALSQDAGPLELYCGLGDMVALLGSKLSVLSCCVLYYGNHRYSCWPQMWSYDI